MPRPAVYILANYKRGTLYVGATGNLRRRVWEHKQGLVEFTSKYNVQRLVHYELYERFPDALQRERQLKRWRRAWKIALIEKENPEWRDLWGELNE